MRGMDRGSRGGHRAQEGCLRGRGDPSARERQGQEVRQSGGRLWEGVGRGGRSWEGWKILLTGEVWGGAPALCGHLHLPGCQETEGQGGGGEGGSGPPRDWPAFRPSRRGQASVPLGARSGELHLWGEGTPTFQECMALLAIWPVSAVEDVSPKFSASHPLMWLMRWGQSRSREADRHPRPLKS